MNYLDYNSDDIDVQVTELLTATSDSADPLLHPNVWKALDFLRRQLNMDAAFVSQFANGRRTFRAVANDPAQPLLEVGQSDPLEQSWCQQVVAGRLPQYIKDAGPLVASGQAPKVGINIGTHLSVPVVLGNGEVYGTLCCFSQQVQPQSAQSDLRRLQSAAKVLADNLNQPGMGAQPQPQPKPPVVLELQPMEKKDEAFKGDLRGKKPSR